MKYLSSGSWEDNTPMRQWGTHEYPNEVRKQRSKIKKQKINYTEEILKKAFSY